MVSIKKKVNWRKIGKGLGRVDKKLGKMASSGLDWYFGADLKKQQRGNPAYNMPAMDTTGDVIFGGMAGGRSPERARARSHRRAHHKRSVESSGGSKKKAPIIIINN